MIYEQELVPLRDEDGKWLFIPCAHKRCARTVTSRAWVTTWAPGKYFCCENHAALAEESARMADVV